MNKQLPVLTCYPCQYKGVCCRYGTSVSSDEEKQIRAIYGDKALRWDEEEQGYRTAVVNDRCFFHDEANGGTCSIHDKEYYPRVCHLFPNESVDGGPYTDDLDICPDLKGY